MPRRPKFLLASIAILIAVHGGVAQAQAQVAGSASGADSPDINFSQVEAQSRWGLRLSEGGLAASEKPAKDDKFIELRDAQGAFILGIGAGVDHRMSPGYRGIWSSDSSRITNESSPSTGVEDDEKIFFYTMRYEDVRLKLSYLPGPQRESGASTGAENSTGFKGVAVGANYDRRFDWFGVGVSAGYASTETLNDEAIPELGGWTFGARLDFGGLQVSGGVQLSEDTREAENSFAPAGWDEAWNLGARYRWGRNDVSLAYGYGENHASLKAPGDDKLDSAALSYIRKLDGGVQWSINLLWADRDGRAGGESADIDGTALSAAIRLSF